MMWEAARDKILGLGGEIAHGPRDEDAGAWTRRAASGPDGRDAPTAPPRPSPPRHVVSSAPITELVAALRPAAEGRCQRRRPAVPRLPHRGADHPHGEHPELPRQLDLHPRSEREGRAHPELPVLVAGAGAGGYACLGLEYFCFEGDGLWTSADADLIALAKQEIGKIGLIRAGGRRRRLRRAPAQGLPRLRRRLRRQRRRRSARRWRRTIPTLHLVGRNGMHKYNNQDHAMMTAMLTAENILAGERRYDVWAGQRGRRIYRKRLCGRREALKSERLVPKRVAA